MSKCFDNELNPVASLTTPPIENLIDRRHGRNSLSVQESCPSIGNTRSADKACFPVCCESRSLCDTNNKCCTNLHLSDLKHCNLEAGNFRQTASAACSMASSSTEPATELADLDDDVRWFFEDASDADVGYNRQSIGDTSPLQSVLDKFAHVGLESADKKHGTVPQMCSSLPFPNNGCVMPTLNGFDKCNGDELLELFVNDSQDFSDCSVSATSNDTFVRSSAELCSERIWNAVKTNSDSHRLGLVHVTQESDKESTSKPQVGLATLPEGLQFAVPTSVLDPRNIEKKSSENSKVSNKHGLRNSRILLCSRHFRSLQDVVCSPGAGRDDSADKVTSDNVHDSALQSSDLLPGQISPDLMNAQVSESTDVSNCGHVPRRTTDRMVDRGSEKTADGELGYFNRLEQIAMCLSHGDDEMMRLAGEICRRQLALNPPQTWFVFIILSLCSVCFQIKLSGGACTVSEKNDIFCLFFLCILIAENIKKYTIAQK